MTTSRSSSATRQKVTVVIFIVVLALVGWQVYGLFQGDTPPVAPAPAAKSQPPKINASLPPPSPANNIPATASVALPKPPILSAKELELIKLQKQTEERYIAAVNQLQMLKIEREIAETNKSIAAARLDTATSEKGITSLTQQPMSSPSYTQNIVAATSINSQETSNTIASNYVVISVSLLQGKWSAVLGNQGKLYQVYIGDVLPENNIKVLDINKTGVILKIGEEKRKVSLVPLI